MNQPSPTKNGFNPDTKEWETEEGKELYIKQVKTFAKYISHNQNNKICQLDALKLLIEGDLIQIQIAHLHTRKDGYEQYEKSDFIIQKASENEVLAVKNDNDFFKIKINKKDLKSECVRVLKINNLVFDAPYFR